MTRRTLPLLTLALALAGVTPAVADSTATGTVAGGGSLRSSADAAPSPANPVIVTVTTAEDFKEDGSGCRTNCSDGPSTITIALKDKHDRANGPGIEGPSGWDYLGPQVDVASSQTNNIAKVAFEVDASLVRPDFNGNGSQFGFDGVKPGQRGERMIEGFEPAGSDSPMADRSLLEKLPDGDYRLTVLQAFGTSFDLFQQSWYLFGYGMTEDLTDTIRNGLKVWMKTNYKASESWKVTVSSAVARTLKLKSTTIGQATFPKPGGKNRRIPLTAAARKALKKYSRVKVTLKLTAKGPDGETMRDSRSVELEKPKSELG
jgi:hypothetical protein